MKIVISPAKSLDFKTPLPTDKFTQPAFLCEAEKIQKTLKKKSAKDLSKLMHISDNLGSLNYQRNQEWQLPFTPQNARPALYAFKGTVYEGLDAYSLPIDKIESIQNKLRILSGLYGLLKPLDLMQAYRLEMGTKIKLGSKDNLYKFWGDTLSKALKADMKPDEVLLNLASNEYFKAINPKVLKHPIVRPIFKDFTKGKLKVVAFFAKKARGLMLRYIIDNQIESTEDVKNFDVAGYAFDSNLSNETQLVFTR
ncbi:MAG: peroxide stress protein YaaA [Flavobacteriaceae bacterium]|nr:peroxide stress protein YaaA [Flavobacteriaceae bacterium]